MKKLAISLFVGFCALSWILVLFLVVMLVIRVTENDDPWSDKYRSVPVPPRASGPLPAPVTWTESTVPIDTKEDGFCSWGIPTDKEDAAQEEARRRLFPSLSWEDRIDFAAAHGEAVVHYSPLGEPLNTYVLPNYMAENVEHQLKPQPNAQASEMSRYDFVTSTPRDIFYLEDPRDRTVFAFRNARKRLMVNKPDDAPDSPWEIPVLRYKRNLRYARNLHGKYSSNGKSNHPTNNAGYVSENIVIPKPKGLFRIICLGGSTTEEHTRDDSYPGEGGYPDRVQKRLQKRFPQTPIEVVNCGVGGKNSTGSVILLADYLALEPNLILIYDGVNDIVPLVKSISNISGQSSEKEEPFQLPADEVIDQKADACTIRNFHVIARVARCLGVPVVMCSNAAPDLASLSPREKEFFGEQMHTTNVSLQDYCRCLDRLNRRILALCEREKMLYIPVHENMGGGFYYFYDICHMLERGIARKAEIIAGYLQDYLAPCLDRQGSVP